MSDRGTTGEQSVPTTTPQPALHDLDDGHREATEVRVYWQDTLLQTTHLCPPRPFLLASHAGADLRLDDELLGQREVSIPCAPGRYDIAGLTLVVARVTAARRLPVPLLSIDWKQQSWTLASFAVCATFLLLVALLPPNVAALSLQRLDGDQRYAAFDYITPPVVIDTPDPVLEAEAGGSGEAGEPAPGEPGQSGDPKAEPTRGRRAHKGPARASTMTRDQLVAAASQGMLGALRSQAQTMMAGRYVAATAIGSDPESALGAVLGDLLGPNRGNGGLGMIGTGRGQVAGAGTIGVGPLGTRGSCMGPRCGVGSGRGTGIGPGTGIGRLGKRAARVPPRITSQAAQVKGSLSKETIRRVIGRQLQKVRFCYEQGLQRRPDLSGRVAVKFIIAADGAVRASAVSHATLGDVRVEQCIAKVVSRLSFPAPDGIVTVTYPFTLQAAGR